MKQERKKNPKDKKIKFFPHFWAELRHLSSVRRTSAREGNFSKVKNFTVVPQTWAELSPSFQDIESTSALPMDAEMNSNRKR